MEPPRTVGSAASVAGYVSTNFDLQSYVPASIQDDYATGAGYYHQFQQATQGISIGPHGTVQVSDAAANSLLYTMAAAASAAVPVAAPFIAAFLLIYSQLPKAGAGPGVCSTDPPISSAPSDLAAWPHFTSWESVYGAYPTAAANTFEAYANPVLQYNWTLGANCFGDSQTLPPTLLATLIASWNATHSSSKQRTVTRSFAHIKSFGVNAGYDPIADALMTDIVAKNTHLPDDPTFEQATNPASYTGPDQATSSFVINDGPVILTPITLHIPGGATKASAPPSTSASVGKRVAVASLIIVGAGAAGIGVWAMVTHTSYLGALKKLWSSSGGRVVKGINPLPLSAGEASSKKSTTVQTLIFPRPRYSESRAKAWAKAHSYLAYKTDVTEHSVRIRQRSPSAFKSGTFRTITLGNSGVKAVVGHLR